MKCSRSGCQNQVNPPKGTIQYYCSKRCRYLGRGSKRGKRLVDRASAGSRSATLPKKIRETEHNLKGGKYGRE